MKRLVLVLILLLAAVAAFAQTESARVSGRVTDSTGAVIVGAQCTITNIGTNGSATTATNSDGIYVLPNLRPATYRLIIQKDGFHTVVKPGLELHVQDAIDENFTLAVGSTSESITVTGGAPLLQTESASVGTVVDSQFVDNMPLNGRSFQSLIFMTPGVIIATGATGDNAGQFSVNGQRTDANYFTVDGVSANFGTGTNVGQGSFGTLPGFTALGGTNGLVSVDAMQEFRIQTSTYAPEYGRQSGGQISIVTKGGTNKWHGTASDYLRNDDFDARSYFDFATPNNGLSANPLPKPALRQNDFGGTFSGPIWKDKTFFFFSYEGLRLLQPELNSRYFITAAEKANLTGAWAQVANSVPTGPNGSKLYDQACGPTNSVPGQTLAPDDPSYNPCETLLVAAQSNPTKFNAYSIRIDHNLTKKINLFGRYNHTPSYTGALYMNNESDTYTNTDTMTLGSTASISPTMVNDFRANWSRSKAAYDSVLYNTFGATVGPMADFFPPGQNPQRNQAYFSVSSSDGAGFGLRLGQTHGAAQRQWNFVDTLSKTVGVHQLKLGVDWRRLSPISYPLGGNGYFPSWSAAVDGMNSALLQFVGIGITGRMDNWSFFGQDTWKASRRLTLTYGLRWDINTPPVSETPGKPLYNVSGIYDSNPVALVAGPLWSTRYANFGPRFGAAYQVTPQTVVRGGFGLFYDLGYGGDVGNTMGGGFPYSQTIFTFGNNPFNLSLPVYQLPAPITTLDPSYFISSVEAVDPHLKVPVTYQWNAAFEREIGSKQTITATYAAAYASNLLRSDQVQPVGSYFQTYGGAVLVTHNGGYSHYNSLQLKFMRRMSHGLQALASYTLAQASDTDSGDTVGDYSTNGVLATSVSQLVTPPLTPANLDRRHNVTSAISYNIPQTQWGGRAAGAVLNGWGLDGVYKFLTGPPLDINMYIQDPALGGLYNNGIYERPAQIPGTPVWIPNPNEPDGKQLNPDHWEAPTGIESTGALRNNIRSPYGISQLDFAIRRRFNITERVKLDFRAEYFNLFNHPMFTYDPNSTFWGSCFTFPCTAAVAANPSFGQIGPGSGSPYTVNQGASLWGSPLSPQYAEGGNRSGQLSLRLTF